MVFSFDRFPPLTKFLGNIRVVGIANLSNGDFCKVANDGTIAKDAGTTALTAVGRFLVLLVNEPEELRVPIGLAPYGVAVVAMIFLPTLLVGKPQRPLPPKVTRVLRSGGRTGIRGSLSRI